MNDLSRFVQLAILSFILFVALMASWAIAAYGTPPAWFAGVCAWLLFLWLAAVVGLDVAQDAMMRDAQHKREMRAAGLRRGWVDVAPDDAPEPKWQRDWVWIDDNGNGVVDEGEVRPSIVTIRANARDDGDAGFRACRDVLRWIYDRDAARLSWGQNPGHDAVGETDYEYAMRVFKAMGIVEQRRKGKCGTLVYPTYEAAIATLRDKWQEGGGYVKQHAYGDIV